MQHKPKLAKRLFVLFDTLVAIRMRVLLNVAEMNVAYEPYAYYLTDESMTI